MTLPPQPCATCPARRNTQTGTVTSPDSEPVDDPGSLKKIDTAIYMSIPAKGIRFEVSGLPPFVILQVLALE